MSVSQSHANHRGRGAAGPCPACGRMRRAAAITVTIAAVAAFVAFAPTATSGPPSTAERIADRTYIQQIDGEALAPPTGVADPEHRGFTDVTEQAGLTHVQRRDPYPQPQIGGAAVGDFFGNGYPDLFFTRHDDTDVFYKNMGDGTFRDLSEEVFGPDRLNAPTNGALMADLNSNGHLDLYVTTAGGHRHYLFINDGYGGLIEQGAERGAMLQEPAGELNQGMGVTAGDYTGNHYLDLYVSDWRLFERYAAPRNRLLRNLRGGEPGHFEDVTIQAGLRTQGNHSGFTGRFADMNRDGRMDLLAVNDHRASRYYRNNDDGTFTDVTIEVAVGTGLAEMGSTVADYNNNGYLDWFVTSIGGAATGNRLYRNEMHRGIEGLYFTDQTDAGVREGYWGWGTSFIDYNNDGLRDIVMTNGFPLHNYGDLPTLLFQNEGPDAGYTFANVAEQLGITDHGEGRGLIVADFFNNGFLDILVVYYKAPPVLYRNNGGPNKWLRIDTVGEISHPQGIGAFITVQPRLDDDHALVHDVNLGGNFLSHNETIAHFGLGRLEGAIDYIHIQWPSGIEQEFFDVEPNRLLTIHETKGIIDSKRPERELAATSDEPTVP